MGSVSQYRIIITLFISFPLISIDKLEFQSLHIRSEVMRPYSQKMLKQDHLHENND